MKYPDHRPLDDMLNRSLQSASHSLDGDEFRFQLAARITAQKRRMQLVRLLPAGMGLLATLTVSLVPRQRFDFYSSFSSLEPLWKKSRLTLAWLSQAFPFTHNDLLLWILLAGTLLIFSLWPANRESAIFRL